MKKNNLLILGAGGHGRVVAEAAELQGIWDNIAFLDDRDDLDEVLNFNVIGKIADYKKLRNEFNYVIVAVGNNEIRLGLIDKLKEENYKLAVIIHPKAIISKYATINEGTVILAGAVVNTCTSIGNGCIINISAIIDHDCKLGNGVHVSSGAIVRSMCTISDLTYIDAGSLVKEGFCI
ncbi:NeuD/PglB/VioB family sugar acetyltransferase [Clostridium sp. 'White wine YQ']|uniref:NeuD/PglB/VioB family sugar acetyltransferase n=1 Tax=Clostridium sp. 'White wine YQ' TaxID=3027474 RepID=UPI002366DE98|nr:NeuD/PglB/VioB family sugar acetyltransferase [Clostridium sp. 'White wine YQ']MDD7792767.1 NeuD/PglB/VioB family sugar acetyltransferase [Clostridium sp. 'White wine YQ']